MNNREYDLRCNPLLKEKEEGRDAYPSCDNPYDKDTQFDQHISWEVGWANECDDQALIDMGR